MSDDTADFKFKVQNQKAFVGNASETVFSTQSVVDDEEDTNKLTPQQIKAKLSNQNKLEEQTSLDASEILQRINLLCTFLDR